MGYIKVELSLARCEYFRLRRTFFLQFFTLLQTFETLYQIFIRYEVRSSDSKGCFITQRKVNLNGYSQNRNSFAQREKGVALTV